jgi:hypothetical protein
MAAPASRPARLPIYQPGQRHHHGHRLFNSRPLFLQTPVEPFRLLANAAVAQPLVECRDGGVRAEDEEDGPGALSRIAN